LCFAHTSGLFRLVLHSSPMALDRLILILHSRIVVRVGFSYMLISITSKLRLSFRLNFEYFRFLCLLSSRSINSMRERVFVFVTLNFFPLTVSFTSRLVILSVFLVNYYFITLFIESPLCISSFFGYAISFSFLFTSILHH
jgi:hypothetical protein